MGDKPDKKMHGSVDLIMRKIFIVLLALFSGVALLDFFLRMDSSRIGRFRTVDDEEQPLLINEHKAFGGIMIVYNPMIAPSPKGFRVLIKAPGGQILLEETVVFDSDSGILGKNVPGAKKICETNWVKEMKHPDWPLATNPSFIKSYYMPIKDYGKFLVSVKRHPDDQCTKLYWAPYYDNSW